MVVILATQYIYMKSYPCGHCERVEDMGNHLRREVSNFFAFKA